MSILFAIPFLGAILAVALLAPVWGTWWALLAGLGVFWILGFLVGIFIMAMWTRF